MNILIVKWLLRKKNEGGFVLPLVFGIGFFMLIVGATMIYRSQDDATTALAQKETSSGLAAAETGILRVINFLNLNPNVAQYPSDAVGQTYTWQNNNTWQSFTNSDNPVLGGKCKIATALEKAVEELATFSTGDWVSIEAGKPEDGQFQVEDYEYIQVVDKSEEEATDEGTVLGYGLLKVKGRVNAQGNTDADNKNVGVSVSHIRVKIPMVKSPPTVKSFPGLWTYLPKMSANQKIAGDILLSGSCETLYDDGGVESLEGNVVNGQVIPAPNLYFPPLPPAPQDFLALSDNGVAEDGGFYNELNPITGSATFPRATDDYRTETISGRTLKVYRYRIKSASINPSASPVSIKLGGSEGITIETDDTQMVVFHLDGSIDMGGNNSILHLQKGTSNAATNKAYFQIYGRQGSRADGLYTTPDPFDAGEPFICANGGPQSEFFIYAPNYTYGVAGSGTIYGSVWVKQVQDHDVIKLASCGSNSNQIIVNQQLGLSDLEVIEDILGGGAFAQEPLPPIIRPFIEWERLPND